MRVKEQRLVNHLEGLANSLRNGWIPIKGIYGNLLVLLESEGYLKKVEEHYIVDTLQALGEPSSSRANKD